MSRGGDHRHELKIPIRANRSRFEEECSKLNSGGNKRPSSAEVQHDKQPAMTGAGPLHETCGSDLGNNPTSILSRERDTNGPVIPAIF